MEEPEFSWRPLGRLFVEKGLLTELRLEHALEQQAEKGGQLGEILVSLGYVTSTALARLLGEQYGVELAVDTGFGTGLRAELERRHDSQETGEPRVAPVLALVDPEPERVEDPLYSFAGLEEQWAKLAAADARIADLEYQVETLSRELQERDDEIAELSPQVASGRKRPKPAA